MLKFKLEAIFVSYKLNFFHRYHAAIATWWLSPEKDKKWNRAKLAHRLNKRTGQGPTKTQQSIEIVARQLVAYGIIMPTQTNNKKPDGQGQRVKIGQRP